MSSCKAAGSDFLKEGLLEDFALVLITAHDTTFASDASVETFFKQIHVCYYAS